MAAFNRSMEATDRQSCSGRPADFRCRRPWWEDRIVRPSSVVVAMCLRQSSRRFPHIQPTIVLRAWTNRLQNKPPKPRLYDYKQCKHAGNCVEWNKSVLPLLGLMLGRQPVAWLHLTKQQSDRHSRDVMRRFMFFCVVGVLPNYVFTTGTETKSRRRYCVMCLRKRVVIICFL